MVAPGQVMMALVPWLGTGFLSPRQAMCDRLALMLFSYNAKRDSLPHLAQQVDNLLFMEVREGTKGRFALEMDDGRLIRVRMQDFTLMADELLYLLFEQLERTGLHQAIIREYSMRSGSLSALRALYLLYRDQQSPEENETIRRVITSCHEPWRYRMWIDTVPKEN